ncbi:MAG: proton-conducting transporter transmembrane domain-containing protein [Elusimicrobiota bacterium]
MTFPGIALHFGMDPLSACFLVLVVLVSSCAGIYGEGYLLASGGHIPRRAARLFFVLLAVSMALVVCARNAVLFIIAWEVMALSAFGLISCEDSRSEVRRASLIYLLCTHTGSLCLLTFFALLGRYAGSFEFGAFSAIRQLPVFERTALLALAFIGFGMKAGFLPMHVWLQEAHPAAPSHASALMSGAMIEMGVYGLLRFLPMLGPLPLKVSIILTGIGLVTALFGVLYAMAQRDIKRLLAYSSIENVGIMLSAIGLGEYGWTVGRIDLALLGFSAAIMHALNHGLFKPLLFMVSGTVYQAAGSRDIEACGGLQKRMPWTAAFAAIGAAAIAALPPLNGFTGEWLLYNWLLKPDAATNARITAIGAAVLALVGGLSAVAFSKYFGLIFLGQPRSHAARDTRDPSFLMLAPMGALAALCVIFGVWPAPILRIAFAAAAQMCGASNPAIGALRGEWSGFLSEIGLAGAGIWIIGFLLWSFRSRLLMRRRVERGSTWACGFSIVTARMQYTGSSYYAAAARPFSKLLASYESACPPASYWPLQASFESAALDPVLDRFLPKAAAFARSGLLPWRRPQRGRLQPYLLYVSAFLVIVLLWKL